MSFRPGRFAVIATVSTVLALLITAFLLFRPPPKSADIAMPPPEASPEAVVTTFLDAVNAHDCETAEALAAEGSTEDVAGRCDDVESLTDVVVDQHVSESPMAHGLSATDEVVVVPVWLTVNWRPYRGGGVLGTGAVSWAYHLTRASTTAPWRIFDQGPTEPRA
ncbi:hypothetical protein [Nocardioides insulae]|uniref:hypothetical protein n=1 Tax=Nocardioides insulae TaxID=394734 RepID=UPI00040CF403|nr:hypothetical protein [Nocardioides insulae]